MTETIWTLTAVRIDASDSLGWKARTMAVYASKESACFSAVHNCEIIGEIGYYPWCVVERVHVGELHPILDENQSVWFKLSTNKDRDAKAVQIDGEPPELKTLREAKSVVPWYQDIG